MVYNFPPTALMGAYAIVVNFVPSPIVPSSYKE